MFILLINSMGFPINNFDPKVGDTFKTFYYSHFIVLSFMFLVASLAIRKKTLNVSFIIMYLICSIFIFGFPKKDSNQYYVDLGNRNEHSVLWEVKKIVIHDLDFDQVRIIRREDIKENIFLGYLVDGFDDSYISSELNDYEFKLKINEQNIDLKFINH